MSLSNIMLPKLQADGNESQYASRNTLSRRESLKELSQGNKGITASSSSVSTSRQNTPVKKIKFNIDLDKAVGQRIDKSLNSSRSTALNTVNRSQSTLRINSRREAPESKASSFSRDSSKEKLLDRAKNQKQQGFNAVVRDIVRPKNVSTESTGLKGQQQFYMLFRKDSAPESYVKPMIKSLSKMVDDLWDIENYFRTNPDHSKEEVFDCFHRSFQLAQSIRLYPLIFKILELYSKTARIYGDLGKSIQLLKQYKSLCSFTSADGNKMKCYRWLASICTERQEYDRALIFLKKQLTYAWKIDDYNYELQAYDNMGMQHYYKGDVDLAKYFHGRMVKGIIEPTNSNFRRIAVSSIENSLIKKQVNALTSFKEDENFKIYLSSGEEDIDIPFETKTNEFKDIPEGPDQEAKIQELQEKKLKEERKTIIAVQRAMHNQKMNDKTNDMLKGTGITGRKPLLAEKSGKKAFYTNVGPDTKDLNRWMINFIINSRSGQVGSIKLNDSIRLSHLGLNKRLENFHIMDRPGLSFQDERVHSHSLNAQAKAKVLKLIQKCRNELVKHIHYTKNVASENLQEIDILEAEQDSKRDDLVKKIQNKILG